MQHPDEAELYDLVNDPYEMRNLIDDPSMVGVISDLRAELASSIVDAIGIPR